MTKKAAVLILKQSLLGSCKLPSDSFTLHWTRSQSDAPINRFFRITPKSFPSRSTKKGEPPGSTKKAGAHPRADFVSSWEWKKIFFEKLLATSQLRAFVALL
jgi:hypothetical protein